MKQKTLFWTKKALLSLRSFINWVLLGVILGAVGGVVGGVFHLVIDFVSDVRTAHGWVIAFLPLGGASIALIYYYTKVHMSANDVLNATRTDRKLPFLSLPVIFVSTAITQFVGGSAGKEGAAIQMGGTLGSKAAELLKLDEKDSHVAVMCGLASVFCAVFGTPVTAVLFSIEAISIGAMYYVALIPCLSAVTVSGWLARLMGVHPLGYTVTVPNLNIGNLGATVLLAALCAGVSIIFAMGLHRGERLVARLLKNTVLRGFIGGAIILGLTFLVGNRLYNGAGFELISASMAGSAPRFAFLLKILFTVITISFGFKGGEIVPTMAVGASLGCTVAAILHLDPTFFAALGILALFCGMVNCPVATIMLGVELFGTGGLIFYTAAAAISFALSGNFGLYSSQKLLYSKTKAEFINAKVRE